MVALGTTSAALVRIRSGFVYPPLFDLFRALFFLQYGLFAGMTLGMLMVLAPRFGLPRIAQTFLYFLFHFWLLWILSWGLVHRAYGIELSFASVIDLVAHPQSIGEVGFTGLEFVSLLSGAILIAIAFAAISFALTHRDECKNAQLMVRRIDSRLLARPPAGARLLHSADQSQSSGSARLR
jgi:hypothetical protein